MADRRPRTSTAAPKGGDLPAVTCASHSPQGGPTDGGSRNSSRRPRPGRLDRQHREGCGRRPRLQKAALRSRHVPSPAVSPASTFRLDGRGPPLRADCDSTNARNHCRSHESAQTRRSMRQLPSAGKLEFVQAVFGGIEWLGNLDSETDKTACPARSLRSLRNLA